MVGMTKRPRWVAVCHLDASGLLLRTDGSRGAAATAGTTLRMGPSARGWKSVHAKLPDGTVAQGRRRRLLRGGFEFTFDRVLPEGTEIVFVGRPFARMPSTTVQWWERDPPPERPRA